VRPAACIDSRLPAAALRRAPLLAPVLGFKQAAQPLRSGLTRFVRSSVAL